MAVNRFSKPVNNRVISQFVPQDMRLLASLVQQKQQRYDVATERQEVIQDKLSTLSAVGASDLGILDEAGTAMDELSKEYAGKDLADPRIAKEFMSRSKRIFNNPLIRATQQTATAVAKHKEDQQKAMLAGTYREENDPFAQQLQAYEEAGGAKGGALGYGGIMKGVDEDVEMSKLFNNMPKSGWKNYVMIGDKIKQVGWEGISNKRMFGDPNNPNSSGMVGTQFGAHWNSAAGQQQRRRFAMLQGRGQIPEGMTAEEYVLGHLTSKAQEFVGGISTGGGIGALAGGGGITGGTKASPKFVGPMAKRMADLDLSFDEEGNAEGSGSTTWKQYFNGETDLSWWEILTNDDMTEEEKKAAEPIFIASKMYGLSNKEAALELDVTISPKYTPYKKQADKALAQKEFEQNGSGHYSAMTVYSQDGNALGTGREIFEAAGLMDDGLYDTDKAKQVGVNVLGVHDPNTGLTPAGLHVVIGGETFIFAETTFSPEEEKAAWNADLRSGGVNQADDGTYYVYNKNKSQGQRYGVWDIKNQEINYFDK